MMASEEETVAVSTLIALKNSSRQQHPGRWSCATC
jgi:hypothetical protein